MIKRKNILSRLSKILIGSTFMLSAILVSGIEAKATKNVDGESNDTPATAQTIQLNESYVGTLVDESYGGVDCYRFEIPSNAKESYINIELGAEDITSNAIKEGWRFVIYEEGSADALYSENDYKTTKLSNKLPLQVGVYYLKIYNDSTVYPAKCNYKFKVSLTNNANWETEHNDDALFCNSIDVNKMYYGNLYKSGDQDWFVFTIPQNGKVIINHGADASVDYTTLSASWRMSLYRDGDANMYLYCDQKIMESSPSLYLAAGTYKIKIASSSSVYWPKMNTYNLKVDYMQVANCEAELNDTASTANAINIGEAYTGNIYCGKDQDYFSFVPSIDGNLSLSMKRGVVADPKDGYTFKIIDSYGKVLTSKTNIVEEEATLDVVEVKKGKTYYVFVDSDKISSYVDYQFTTKITPIEKIKESKAKVASIKSKSKKKVTIKWKKNSYAQGYKIYRSTKKNKGYKCIATIKGKKKVSYVDKKVKSKKTYYYKIRAYKKSNGKTIYSKYSPVKKVKVK